MKHINIWCSDVLIPRLLSNLPKHPNDMLSFTHKFWLRDKETGGERWCMPWTGLYGCERSE